MSKNYGKFKLENIFIAQTGDVDLQQKDINGKGEFLLNSGVENYGIKGKTDKKAKIFNKNTITIDFWGNANYRDFNYKMATHNHIFSLSGNIIKNREVGLFLIGAMSGFNKLFSYNNMATWNKLKELEIHLPLKDKVLKKIEYNLEDIDFDYMEERIKELEKERIKELDLYLKTSGLENYNISKKDEEILNKKVEYKEFKLSEIFDDIDKNWIYGKNKQYKERHSKKQKVDIAVISGITINNGINYYTSDKLKKEEIYNDCLTISTRGEYSGTLTYHDEKFCLANNVLVMPMPKLSANSKLYIAGCIKKIGYGGYNNYPRKETLKNDVIILPIDQLGNIDYNYMDKYIEIIKKKVIKDVVLYKDTVIQTTKKII